MTGVVVALPPPLRRWSEWLGWFDAALAERVGDMVRRLSDLVGAAPGAGRTGAPEPDGLGDLRSRGPYERLLASEWLLAEELPDEFLRRAAAAEHLFLAPRLRARQVERSVVAIFDCGPRALGAPRLAHIAAWILLARRAADGGGTLRWGVLQAPGELHAADASTQLGALMRARRLEAGEPAQIERWRATLAAADEPGEREVWWIGATPPEPLDLRRDERALTLRTPFEADALEALLSAPSGTRRAMLALPPARQATALLRGQFVDGAGAPATPRHRMRGHRVSLTQGLLLSAPPGHVGVPELGSSTMLVFAVPHAGQRKVARASRQKWSAVRPPIAGALERGTAMALCTAGDTLYFWQMPRFAAQPRPGSEVLDASAATARWMPLIRLASKKDQRAFVIDRGARLIRWETGWGQDDGATVIDRQVCSMVQTRPDTLVYAMVYGDGLWLRELRAEGTPSPLSRRLCAAPPHRPGELQLHFSVIGFKSAAQVGAVAIAAKQDGAQWTVHSITAPGRPIDAIDGSRSYELALAPGERGIGLANQRGNQAPALVILSSDRRRVRLATADSSLTLHAGDAVIERFAVCPLSGHVALLTRDRQLTVIAASTLEALLVVDGSGAEEEDEDEEARHARR